MKKTEYRVFKVSATTTVQSLSGSISYCIENNENVELRALGASAVNQMYKAIAVARGNVAVQGKDLFIRPGFADFTENNETKTVMVAQLVIV